MADHMTESMAHLLRTLEGYTDPPTTRRLADNLERPGARREYWGYSRASSMLHRMKKRGFVTSARQGRSVKWTITQAGRDARAEWDTADA